MTTAKRVKQLIADFPNDFVFVASDLDFEIGQREAAARTLQRMAERGEISKLSNGKFYKPRMTVFGELKPSPAQIAKEYLVKDGRIIGYMTGGAAFSQYSLTTQITSEIQIGTNKYRRPVKRGKYRISFVVQPNPISENNVDLLQLLDCLRFIKDIPGTTSNEACKRLIYVIEKLNEGRKQLLSYYALKYPPFVKALLGAILENANSPQKILDPLRKSLNGITRYKLPISTTILPTKLNWRIYEPTR